MIIKINYFNEMNIFEDNVAKFKAMLIQKYIDDLNITDEIKIKVKKMVCAELQKKEKS